MKHIETERLLLRGFQLDDMLDLYQFASDDEVALSAGWKPHTCLSDSADIILNVFNAETDWAMVEKASNKVIGSISISEDLFDKEEKMIGFLIHKEYWNQGFGYEGVSAVLQHAFQKLQLTHLYAYHFPDNMKSCRLIHKLQFTYLTRIKKGFQMYNETYLDLEKYVLFAGKQK